MALRLGLLGRMAVRSVRCASTYTPTAPTPTTCMARSLAAPSGSGLPAHTHTRAEEEDTQAPASASASHGPLSARQCAALSATLGATCLPSVALAEGAAAGSGAVTTAAGFSMSPMALSILQVAPPLAAQVVFLAPLQAMREIRKSGTTGQLTPLPYTSMVVNGCLWMTYGALSDMNMTIMAPNLSAFVLGSYYVATFHRYCAPGVNLMPHYVAGSAIMAGCGAVATQLPAEQALNIIGTVGCGIVVVMFSGPLATVQTVLKEKSTASLPFAFTIASFANCTLFSLYGYTVLADPFIYLPNVLGLMSAVAQLGLFARFGIQTPDSKKKDSAA